MFFSTGITPLEMIGQTRIKIRLGRYIDAAQLKASQTTIQKAQTMIVAADSGGQPARNMLGSTAISVLL
jgi:hypothetical protein